MSETQGGVDSDNSPIEKAYKYVGDNAPTNHAMANAAMIAGVLSAHPSNDTELITAEDTEHFKIALSELNLILKGFRPSLIDGLSSIKSTLKLKLSNSSMFESLFSETEIFLSGSKKDDETARILCEKYIAVINGLVKKY